MKRNRSITAASIILIIILGTVLITDKKIDKAKDNTPSSEIDEDNVNLMINKEIDSVIKDYDKVEANIDTEEITDITDTADTIDTDESNETNGLLPAHKVYLLQLETDYIYTELYGASNYEPYELYHVKCGDRYGYLSQYGSVVGSITYDWSAVYNEGIGVVKKGEKWAAVDEYGRLIRPEDPFIFDEVSYPANGMLPVRIGEKWGILCTDGHILGSIDYGLEGICYDSVVINSNRWGVIFQVQLENRYAFLDTDGSIVGNRWFQSAAYMNENGTAGIVYDENGDSIIFKRDGREIKLPDGWYLYSMYGVFNDGYASVYDRKGNFNFISESGEMLCDMSFELVIDFYYGRAIVGINGKRGIINMDGTIWGGVDNIIYDEAWPMIDDSENHVCGYARVCIDDKWGIMDSDGNIIGGADGICYDVVSAAILDGYVTVHQGNSLGFLNMDGTLLGGGLLYYYEDMIQNDMFFESYFNDGLAPVSKGYIGGGSKQSQFTGFGYVRTDGTMLYEENPYRFEEARSFENGFAVVKMNNRYGVIDKSGIEVLPAIYRDIKIGGTRLGETTFFITEDGSLWGVIKAEPDIKPIDDNAEGIYLYNSYVKESQQFRCEVSILADTGIKWSDYLPPVCTAEINVWSKASDELVQKITYEFDLSSNPFMFTADLLICDVNFDGQEDLRLDLGRYGNQGVLRQACFLWDDDSKEFVYEPSFEEIMNPEIDAENQVILSNWRNSAGSYGYAMYSYQESHFVLSDRLTMQYDWNLGIEYYTEETLAEGELVVIQDRVRKSEISMSKWWFIPD